MKEEKLKSEKNVNSIISQLKEIYNAMVCDNISELELENANVKFKIKRYTKKETVLVEKSYSPAVEMVKEEKESEEVHAEGEEILSPINGIFYRSPSPSSPPFVKEGDVVNPGDTLCIIEAMKVMNQIKSEKKCKIIKILCENNTPVSAGTKLFLVQPV